MSRNHRVIVAWVAAVALCSACYTERTVLESGGDVSVPDPETTVARFYAAGGPAPGPQPRLSVPIMQPGRCDPNPTLEEFCGRPGSECPSSVKAASQSYCELRPYPPTTQSNACGGVIVSVKLVNSGTEYTFDSSGKLVGIHSWSDVPDDACGKTEYFYGSVCVAVGLPAAVCSGVRPG